MTHVPHQAPLAQDIDDDAVLVVVVQFLDLWVPSLSLIVSPLPIITLHGLCTLSMASFCALPHLLIHVAVKNSVCRLVSTFARILLV